MQYVFGSHVKISHLNYDFRRENDSPINEKEIVNRWDVCIASMRKMTEIFMRMRENLGT